MYTERKIISSFTGFSTIFLGEFAKRAIVIGMEEKVITISDIVNRPEEFMEELRLLFGSGARSFKGGFHV